MRCVVTTSAPLPGYNVCGPIMTPQNIDARVILKWLASGIEVYEVMEDGSRRRLSFNDTRLKKEIDLEYDRYTEIPQHEEKPLEVELTYTIKYEEKKPDKIVIEPEIEEDEVVEGELVIDDLEDMNE